MPSESLPITPATLPRRERPGFAAYAFLILLCLAFFLPGFAALPPTDRDESSFAQATKQMIETHDYTDIRLQDAPRYKKPIGIYWLQAAAVNIADPAHLNEIWAYRLPSLLGAIFAVIMTATLGAFLFGTEAGLLAAIMLAGCVLLNVEARLAKTDAALLGCIVTAMYGLARACFGERRRDTGEAAGTMQDAHPAPLPPGPAFPLSFPHFFLFWTAFAAGILIKGPIILMPLAGVLIWARISDGHLGWIRALRPVPGLAWLALLVLPWFVVITLHSHGAFLHQSAGDDMLKKLWQGQNRGIVPPGAHLLALPVLFFPFSLLTALALPDTWRSRREETVRFCLGWIVPTWIMFELSLTKLPHYVLPTYPAIALLTAHALRQGLPAVLRNPRRLPLALTIGLWLMIGTGYAVLFALAPVADHQGWSALQIGAGAALIAAQLAALACLARRPDRAAGVLALGGLLFLTATFGATLPGLQHVWLSREIVAAARAHAPCVGSPIVAAGYHEPSLVFMAGTHTLLVPDGAAAAAALLDDRCRVAVVAARDRDAFLAAFPAGAGPEPRNRITGLNTGHGRTIELDLFTFDTPPEQSRLTNP